MNKLKSPEKNPPISSPEENSKDNFLNKLLRNTRLHHLIAIAGIFLATREAHAGITDKTALNWCSKFGLNINVAPVQLRLEFSAHSNRVPLGEKPPPVDLFGEDERPPLEQHKENGQLESEAGLAYSLIGDHLRLGVLARFGYDEPYFSKLDSVFTHSYGPSVEIGLTDGTTKTSFSFVATVEPGKGVESAGTFIKGLELARMRISSEPAQAHVPGVIFGAETVYENNARKGELLCAGATIGYRPPIGKVLGIRLPTPIAKGEACTGTDKISVEVVRVFAGFQIDVGD